MTPRRFVGRLPSGGGTANVTEFGYDRGGNQTYKTLPNGLEERRTFDGLGRVLTIDTLSSTSTVVASYDYSQPAQGHPTGYDRVGNVLRIVETYPTGTQPGREVANAYDHTYRLTAEVIQVTAGNLTDTRYSYDKGHNRTQKRVSVNSAAFIDHNYQFGTTTDGYNSNQLKSFNRPGTGEIVEFIYDADGSRETRVVKDASNVVLGTDTFSWDQDSRLVELSLNTGSTADQGSYGYLYDHRTRRVARVEPATTGLTRVVYLGGTSVAEYHITTSNTIPKVEYVRANGMGGGVGSVLYSLRSGVLSSTHYNSRGDVTARADATGSFTYTAAYQAFGTHESETGTNPDRQQANTKEEDPTGLLNEGFRYRDLETGMFISRDPLGFVDGPNVYTYVRQNPWTMFDPLGLALSRGELENNTEWARHQKQKVQNMWEDARSQDGGPSVKDLENIGKEYEYYQTMYNDLQRDAGDFVEDQSFFTDGDAQAVQGVHSLPVSIGGSVPSRAQLAELTETARSVQEQYNALSERAQTQSNQAHAILGFGDGVSFGMSSALLDDGIHVDRNSGYYKGGELAGMAVSTLATGGSVASVKAIGSGSRMVKATTWASRGVEPMLTSGKWVVNGGKGITNYLRTGLWGGKFGKFTGPRFVGPGNARTGDARLKMASNKFFGKDGNWKSYVFGQFKVR